VAVFHRAVLTPTKDELLAAWVPTRPWGGPGVEADGSTTIGSYRFDDPDGRVGLEVHLLRTSDGALLQAPLTYREEPLEGAAESALITTMEHSVLGRRWVYDGVADPVFPRMLAAVTMTGQGEALGMAVYEGRWHIAPTEVRISGGGWSMERVPVDGFTLVGDDERGAVLRNDRFELWMARRPVCAPRPPIALTATWPAQPEPVLLAEVRAS
jgi:hypothetical protein